MLFRSPSPLPAPAAPPSRASGSVAPAPATTSRRSSGAGSLGEPCPAPAFDDDRVGVVPGGRAVGGVLPYQPATAPGWGGGGGVGTAPPPPSAAVAPDGGGATAHHRAEEGTGAGPAAAALPPPPPHLHPAGLGRGMLGYTFTRACRPNYTAWALTTAWLAALAFYLYVRAAHTLRGLAGAYLGYGIFVLAVEALGSTTVALYAYNLLWVPLHEAPTPDADSPIPGMPRVALPYHVRVLVPCYKEDLDIVQRTILAAAAAPLPAGCARTVYLCDDGKDNAKKAWVASLGAGFVYVSGRARPAGEMNGKSGNLNNVCRQLYPAGVAIPGSELVCVFDADQVATSEFFTRTLTLFDGGDDVAMVLSPQVS